MLLIKCKQQTGRASTVKQVASYWADDSYICNQQLSLMDGGLAKMECLRFIIATECFECLHQSLLQDFTQILLNSPNCGNSSSIPSSVKVYLYSLQVLSTQIQLFSGWSTHRYISTIWVYICNLVLII